MIVRVGGGEYRLPCATEKALAQGHVELNVRQQLLAAIIAVLAAIQGLAVGHGGAFQAFVKQAQTVDQLVDRMQHRPGHVVDVYLIAAHHQPGRPLRGIVQALGEPGIGAHQTITAGVVRLAAGAMQQRAIGTGNHQRRSRAPGMQQMGQGGRQIVLLSCATPGQVVLDQRVDRQGFLKADIQQMHISPGAHGKHPAGRAIRNNFDSLVALAALQRQHHGQALGRHQPDQQTPGLQLPQDRAGDDGRKRVGFGRGHGFSDW